MQPTPATRKTITLSPEARAALKLPLVANYLGIIRNADGEGLLSVVGVATTFPIDAEIATFVAALVNEALTPAEPVRMCSNRDCLDAALVDGAFCATHDAELRAECGVKPRWTAADILRREG